MDKSNKQLSNNFVVINFENGADTNLFEREIKKKLTEVINNPNSLDIVLDFENIHMINSRIIGDLVSAHQKLIPAGRSLQIVGVKNGSHLQQIFQTTGLDYFIPFYSEYADFLKEQKKKEHSEKNLSMTADYIVIKLKDLDNMTELEKEVTTQLAKYLNSSYQTIVLDLTEIEFINSTIIGEIIITIQKLQLLGRHLYLIGVRDKSNLGTLISVTGLLSFIKTFTNEEEFLKFNTHYSADQDDKRERIQKLITFDIEQINKRGVLILSLIGLLNRITGMNEIKEKFSKAVAEGHNQILFDLTRLTYIDSEAIGCLIKFHQTLNKNPADGIVFYNPNIIVKEVFDICRLQEVIPCYQSLDEALAHFHSH